MHRRPRVSREAGDELLAVTGLEKHFPIREGLLQRQVGAVQAVDGLDFDVQPGETLGAGRRVRLRQDDHRPAAHPAARADRGHDRLRGPRHHATSASGEMRPLRRDIQMIFQDPYSSLNPRHTVGTIVGAPFRLQQRQDRAAASRRRCRSCSSWSGSTPSTTTATRTSSPAASASASASPARSPCGPKLIVADEPVSALDVSIQAQVVNLLEDLQDEFGLTYVFIAHDLSVVRHISDRVAVMYLGKIVEMADRDDALRAPDAPVHGGAAVGRPGAGPERRATKRERIRLHGDVPSPINPPSGCRFHTRCWKAQDICTTDEPPLLQLAPGHQVACHFPENQPSDKPVAPAPSPDTQDS